MISEEMLKKAAMEADQIIRDSLPAPAECEHDFSPSFQKKMRRIFRKANHPVIYKLPKYAASFVLVVALASSTWLTVDAEARTAFFAWVREQYETYIEYRFGGQSQVDTIDAQYTPTWLPEGFSMLKCSVLSEKTHIIYENDSGERLAFLYLKEADVTKIIKGKTILSDINLSLSSGNIYGFVGSNGSGKTMLFRALSGLMSITSGKITLDAKILKKDFMVLPSLGILLENISLYSNLTGYENLRYLAQFNQKAGNEDIEMALKRVGLDPYDKRKYGKYSLGMKQRLAIAQAIMEKPDILMLDEPT